ncbi:hypothetical protein [Ralstonia pseudosolanacearum]|uniref:hypothetical protein n=1 Tax=Ralstonia pseudosolanacearum TaxID=1310165 RepID=UPI001FFAE0B0|nr:hypothetical protein [Ralstonia pseudosolanacearum]
MNCTQFQNHLNRAKGGEIYKNTWPLSHSAVVVFSKNHPLPDFQSFNVLENQYQPNTIIHPFITSESGCVRLEQPNTPGVNGMGARIPRSFHTGTHMKSYAFHRAGRIALIAGSLLAIGQSASSYAAASAPVVPEGYVYRDQLVANASAHCVSIDFKLLSGKTETRQFVDDSYVVLEAKNLGVHYKTANVTFYKSDAQCSGEVLKTKHDVDVSGRFIVFSTSDAS